MKRDYTPLNKISQWHTNVSQTIDDMETDPETDLHLHEYSYYVGAEHAFADSLGILRQCEAEAEGKRLSKTEKLALAAAAAGIAYLVYPAAKSVLELKTRKLRKSFRESAARGAKIRERQQASKEGDRFGRK